MVPTGGQGMCDGCEKRLSDSFPPFRVGHAHEGEGLGSIPARGGPPPDPTKTRTEQMLEQGLIRISTEDDENGPGHIVRTCHPDIFEAWKCPECNRVHNGDFALCDWPLPSISPDPPEPMSTPAWQTYTLKEWQHDPQGKPCEALGFYFTNMRVVEELHFVNQRVIEELRLHPANMCMPETVPRQVTSEKLPDGRTVYTAHLQPSAPASPWSEMEFEVVKPDSDRHPVPPTRETADELERRAASDRMRELVEELEELRAQDAKRSTR